jgi:hypothetical protein
MAQFDVSRHPAVAIGALLEVLDIRRRELLVARNNGLSMLCRNVI